MPTLTFEETVEMTVGWYKSFYNEPKDILNISLDQIESYTELAKNRARVWVND